MTYGIGAYALTPYAEGGGALVPAPANPLIPYPCPCGRNWRFEAAQITSGLVRAVLLPVAADFQTILDDVGTGTLTLPSRGVNIRDVWPMLTVVYATRIEDDPENPEVMFAGIIEQTQVKGGTVTIGLQAIEHYLRKRTIRATRTYTSQPQTAIAASLVNSTVPGGIQLVGQGLPSAYNRDRTYDAANRQVVWDALTELVQSENGPEWSLQHTKTNGNWSTKMLFEDRVGADTTLVLQSDVEGTDYGLTVNGSDIATLADAIGDGGLIATATDTGPYPEYDAAPQFTGVTDATVLQEQAAGWIQTYSEPFATPEFSIPGGNPKPRDLRLGDSAEFHINGNAASFHGRARVQSITWRLADGAPETRLLGLRPVGRASQTVLNQVTTETCPVCR